MQFFPILTSDNSQSALKTKSSALRTDASFEGFMNRLGKTATAPSSSKNANIPTTQAMLLSGSNINGSSLRDKLLTPTSKDSNVTDLRNGNIDIHTFNGLKSKLADLGVDDETLNNLKDAASQGSLTWNGLLHTLSQNPVFSGKEAVATKLSDATRNGTDSLLQKIGFTPEESEDTLTDIENGDLSKAWTTVLDKIAKLSTDATLSVSQSDIANIGKAMRMDDANISRMQQLLAGQQEGEVTASGLKELLGEISTKLASKKTAAEQRIASLKETIAPAMEQAWERSSQLEASSARASKDSEASSILIKDSVTASGNGLSETTAGSTGHKDVTREARSVSERIDERNRAHEQELQSDRDAGVTGQIKTGNSGKDGKYSGSAFAGKDSSEQRDSSTKDSSAEGLKTLLNRLEYHTNQVQTASGTQQDATATTAALNTAKAADQRIFEQVESGMLKTMQNGAKQLTLQLNPEDLGKVTIILSVKNNEVNAVIRPESAEAAKAINDQLHQLKASLENQGLKVDNIDVQTGLQNNLSSNGWQGSAEHNAQQEMGQKFLNQRRLHNLLSGSSDLAQEMQPIRETEISSTRTGLDIIA